MKKVSQLTQLTSNTIHLYIHITHSIVLPDNRPFSILFSSKLPILHANNCNRIATKL